MTSAWRGMQPGPLHLRAAGDEASTLCGWRLDTQSLDPTLSLEDARRLEWYISAGHVNANAKVYCRVCRQRLKDAA